MQHLGEICMAQRSRGKDKQDKRQAKARKEIQKRSFWRRFFSSFLSLLKEKRPPEAKKNGFPRRRERRLGMTDFFGRQEKSGRPVASRSFRLSKKPPAFSTA